MQLFSRIKNIILSPKLEWKIIKNEPSTATQLFLNYVFILALIPSLAIIIRYTVFGNSFGEEFTKLSTTYTFVWACLSYIAAIIIVLLESVVVVGLSKHFGSEKDFISSLKIVVYSNTIIWISGILSVFPYLGFVGFFAAVYALYTIYFGLAIVKDVPEQKLIGFSASIVLLFIVINIMFAVFSSTILIGLSSVN